MKGTFTFCLRHYFQSGDNGRTTSLSDLKPFILDRGNREAYAAELTSYGYEIG